MSVKRIMNMQSIDGAFVRTMLWLTFSMLLNINLPLSTIYYNNKKIWKSYFYVFPFFQIFALEFYMFFILDLSFELQSTQWVWFYSSLHVSGQIVSINLFKQFFAFILLKCVPAKANQQHRIQMQNSSVMRNVGCVGYVLYLLHSGKLSERLSS